MAVFYLFPSSKWLLHPLLYPKVSCSSMSGQRVFATAKGILAAASTLGLNTWPFESEYPHCSGFGPRYSEYVFCCSES